MTSMSNENDTSIKIGFKKEFFAWLPNCIVYEWGLSAEAIAVALYLNGKPTDWQARPFDIKNHFKWGDHTWRKVSKELKEHNLLHEKVTQKGTQLWFELPEMNLVIHKSATVENRAPRIPARGKSTPLSNKDITDKDLLTDKEKTCVQNVVNIREKITAQDIERIFNELWHVYPLKRGKQNAYKALSNHLDGLTVAEAERLTKTIWDGLMGNVNEHNAKAALKEQGADIWYPNLPHLSTWLNQKRWEDEYEQPQDILSSAKKRPGVLDLDSLTM